MLGGGATWVAPCPRSLLLRLPSAVPEGSNGKAPEVVFLGGPGGQVFISLRNTSAWDGQTAAA